MGATIVDVIKYGTEFDEILVEGNAELGSKAVAISSTQSDVDMTLCVTFTKSQ